MTLTSATREKLNWLFLESALIVISILLAFWIDAWWSDRESRVVEREILSNVLEEFRSRRDALDNERHYISAILSATNELLHATTKRDRDLGQKAIDSLLAEFFWDIDPNRWSLPILNAVVSGDDLRVLSGPHLRRELVIWTYRINRIRGLYLRDNELRNTRINPFMEEHVVFPQILNAIDHVPGFPERTYNHPVHFEIDDTVDHSYLLEDRRFQGLLALRSGNLTDILYLTSEDVQKDMDSTIKLLEQALEKARQL